MSPATLRQMGFRELGITLSSGLFSSILLTGGKVSYTSSTHLLLFTEKGDSAIVYAEGKLYEEHIVDFTVGSDIA